MKKPSSYFAGITPAVVWLGLVSFFTDIASEMLYPIIPLFLTGTLGLSKDALGAIEGLAEGLSTGLRWVGGVLSDLAERRKPFILCGYSISALAKPLMGLAAGFRVFNVFIGGWWIFLVGRSADRLGKSVRTAARDALIADATAPEHRGAAFGLHRAMDTCGAILGPLLALAILWARPQTPLACLFFLALAPGAISTAIALLFVHERRHAPNPADARNKLRFWQGYTRPFWQLLAAAAVFSLGNSSDALLIQRSAEMRYGPHGPLATEALFATSLYALFNTLYALAAAPAGRASDKLPRKFVIAAGWILYALVYAGFAALNSPWAPWLLFAIYGLYQALTEGVTKAYIADLVHPRQRAGAIGLYYTIAGLGQLLASLLAGILWQHLGPAPAFGLSTACALLALPLLLAVRKPPS